MKKENRNNFLFAACFLTAFALWTAAICFVDVKEIASLGSSVGFATLNQFVHELTGVHFTLYNITDWLGLVPLGVVVAFAILGLCQWIKRKKLTLVDRDILALGGYYVAVMGVYLFFEEVVINYRPVLIDGRLEASYPSSTTMLVLCVMPTLVMQLDKRIKNGKTKKCAAFATHAFTAFMVLGRLISGVHWFSDIAGGVLLSIGLILIYRGVVGLRRK